MRLHRFYIERDLAVGTEIIVDETTHIHQWLSVFRYKTGDKVMLFNGNGNEYEAEFTELHKKKAILNILEEEKALMPSERSGKEVHLYLAAIKKDLFELAIEKCTELGVSSITPIITERTQDKNLNMERLMRVAVEASEQSGRGDVPRINESVSLHTALESAKGYSVFVAEIPDESDHTTDQEMIKKSSRSSKEPLALFIGPEGGWGEKDKEAFKNYFIEKIALGETVLRAETAAIVGCFMLLK